MDALITGITGFVGGHLAEHLRQQGDRVMGLARRPPPDSTVPVVAADVGDTSAIRNCLAELRPHVIYHLAGQPNVSASFAEPAATWRTNLDGTRTLYDAVRAVLPHARIVFVGTAAVYGDSDPQHARMNESTVLAPTNPYAASKAAADLLSFQYVASYRLDIVRARPFNHVGPRQSTGFVVPDFARQIARMERGLGQATLRVGDLRPVRDFTDVRDVVRAYRLIAQHGTAGSVYNVGSGVGRSIREVLDALCGFAQVPIAIETDAALLRPGDPRAVIADTRAIHAATGWAPSLPIETTLHDVLDDWRHRIEQERNPA